MGKLKDTGSRSIVDKRKKIIRVELKCVNYPSVSVTYYRKLKDGDKCKIVTEKTKPDKVKKYDTIVCNK